MHEHDDSVLLYLSATAQADLGRRMDLWCCKQIYGWLTLTRNQSNDYTNFCSSFFGLYTYT